jgi:predicted ATP-binding protein involved in virulence
MPIAHLFAEGIGPFKSVHLDFRGPDGHPALGPHILAGVNGSGKSTLLRAIAWCLAKRDDEFPLKEWSHFLHSSHSRAMIVLDFGTRDGYGIAVANLYEYEWNKELKAWAENKLSDLGIAFSQFRFRRLAAEDLLEKRPGIMYAGIPALNVAAYSSAKSIHYLDRPVMGLPREESRSKRFAFESTVQNEAIQSWLLALYSKNAIAKERHESSSRYTDSFEALERALQCICGEDVSIVVDIEPVFQPRLRIGSQTLNFSQIPDGVKTTLGWLSDFMMRADGINWDPTVANLKPGLLLFDEIEGFLHPLWQRRLLPALRAALPTTQSIVTSHSPFVISSCRDSNIHVLKVNRDGTAYAERPVKAPIGESITATLKDIFGVDSRFDVETEKELGEWNELNKLRQERKLSTAQQNRFRDLTDTLASRSEELRSLVNPVRKLPKSTVDKLTEIPASR